jgi:DNA-binding LacI/PurR family transcriptional regulator
MFPARPTVRAIARSLNLSRSTVSNALRSLPTVKLETRHLVQETARTMGYVHQPFASVVMSRLRRPDRAKPIGTLAVLELDEPSRSSNASMFNAQLLDGIRERAAEIGFGVSTWKYGRALRLSRLNQILQWRGIEGVVVLPAWGDPDLTALDWTNFSGVYLDHRIRSPAMHTVCSDHFRRVIDAMEKTRTFGYRRAGLVLERRLDERIDGRFVGAYMNYVHTHPEMGFIPPLLVDAFERDSFLSWFREHQPEVVITHWLEAPRVMAAAGARIPQTHGYICLNVLGAPPGYTGFDQRPGLLGACAAEILISHLSHGSRGAPTLPASTSLPATWVEGATIRPKK